MGKIKEQLLYDEEQEKKQSQSIDEIFNNVDLNIKKITIELITGEIVTIPESEYNQLKEMGELY